MDNRQLLSHKDNVMKFINNIGFILLAVYLICMSFIALGVLIPSVIVGLLALAAAIFILIGR